MAPGRPPRSGDRPPGRAGLHGKRPIDQEEVGNVDPPILAEIAVAPAAQVVAGVRVHIAQKPAIGQEVVIGIQHAVEVRIAGPADLSRTIVVTDAGKANV